MAKKIKEKISTVLSIPQEIVMDVPRIVFDSNTKVYIENFKGICEYSSDSIKINAGSYIISLSGENLEIQSMTGEEMMIVGLVKAVSFCF